MENNDIFTELLRSLEERAHAIVVQNRALLTRLECLGFNPVKELDFTANNAGVLIHRLFEAISRIRLGHAKEMIAEGRSVTETAAACGFADPSYFSKCFRRAFGHSPSRECAE